MVSIVVVIDSIVALVAVISVVVVGIVVLTVIVVFPSGLSGTRSLVRARHHETGGVFERIRVARVDR